MRPISEQSDSCAHRRFRFAAGAKETVGELLTLIRDEYDEMPGLVLTSPQVCRMFRVSPPTCDLVMDGFVTRGLLVRLANGSYANDRARNAELRVLSATEMRRSTSLGSQDGRNRSVADAGARG
jgi:hypothetical protein